MGHLSPEEIIDVADGAPEPPHLAFCDECRAQLADTRIMMAAAAEIPVPEPSPLFWEHFSARVRGAVAAEAAPRAQSFVSWRILAPIAALATAAAVVIAVGPGRRTDSTASAVPAPAAARVEAPVEPRALLSDDLGDPGLAFVADLAEGADVDLASVTTLGVNSADHAVAHLNEPELRALAELLKADMPQGRAS